MATQTYARSPDLSDSALQAETLLNRYPDLTEQELASLIRTFASLPLLDFGLLAADERLGEKLDAFYRDHGDKLRTTPFGLMWSVAIPAVLAFALLLWLVA